VTFLEAAIVILREADRPLTNHEITERALARGLIQTAGKTPEATMSAALYGASPDAGLRRDFRPGRRRAARGSVRWTYAAEPSRTTAAAHGRT